MENLKGERAIEDKRRGILNMLDNRLDELCTHLAEVTSSINLKVGNILDFEPILHESKQETTGAKNPSTFSESIGEKIQRLEAVANDLHYIDNHLANIIN